MKDRPHGGESLPGKGMLRVSLRLRLTTMGAFVQTSSYQLFLLNLCNLAGICMVLDEITGIYIQTSFPPQFDQWYAYNHNRYYQRKSPEPSEGPGAVETY